MSKFSKHCSMAEGLESSLPRSDLVLSAPSSGLCGTAPDDIRKAQLDFALYGQTAEVRQLALQMRNNLVPLIGQRPGLHVVEATICVCAAVLMHAAASDCPDVMLAAAGRTFLDMAQCAPAERRSAL